MLDKPPIIPEKKPNGIVIFFSRFGLIFWKSRPTKLTIAAKIIDTAIIFEIVVISISRIRVQPTTIPKAKATNIGANLYELIPFFICICKILVTKIGMHNNIIEVVGGKNKAIIGTENIDIPIPTMPLIRAPQKTEIKIIKIISNWK